jgi:hypothetical protein
VCSNIAVNVTFRDLNICNILEWLRAARAFRQIFAKNAPVDLPHLADRRLARH